MRWILALVFALALYGRADAGPAIGQAPACGVPGGTTLSLGANPLPGHILSVLAGSGSASLATMTITDSLSRAPISRLNYNNTATNYGRAWDEVTNPTQTSVFTVNFNGGVFCEFDLTSAVGTFVSATGAAAAITNTMGGVIAGDVVGCLGGNNAGGAATLATTQGTFTAITTGVTQYQAGYFIAPATASTTVTYTQAGAFLGTLTCVDYTTPAAIGNGAYPAGAIGNG